MPKSGGALGALVVFFGAMGALLLGLVESAGNAGLPVGLVWVLRAVAILSLLAAALFAYQALVAEFPAMRGRATWVTASFVAVSLSLAAGWLTGKAIAPLHEETPRQEAEAFADQLDTSFSALVRDRVIGLRALESARSPAAQVSAARTAAKAFARQGHRVARRGAPPGQAELKERIAAHLLSVAGAYEGLATAADDDHGDQRALEGAERRLMKSERGLRDAQWTLAQAGYLVVASGR